jgi:RNA polymerase sigma-70 factor (ECF subfamily)
MTPAGTSIVENEIALSDRNLIIAAQRGDRTAFGTLVTRNWVGVVNVVYRMCGELHIAEEAAQEAFLRVWQHLQGYDPHYSFRAWIYRIAINAALDALRREKPVVDIDSIAEDSFARGGEERGPEDALEWQEKTAQVRGAIMALPAPSRSVLVLREYGDLSYAEIASSLGIPLGTVMSRLNAARKQLRQSLEAQMVTGLVEV